MQEKLLNSQADVLKDIEYNYKTIEENISAAAQKRGLDRKEITFLGATKTVDADLINFAIGLGLSYIGENKVQELLTKYEQYHLDNCSLQFIGHLQSNKIKQIIGKVDMIQSVDSIKLAQEIGKQSIKNNLNTPILIEVNIGKEESKFGVFPEQLEEILGQMALIKGISIKGLMTIPPICDKKTEISKYFSFMNKLFIDIKGKKMDNVSMDFLSMGMSADYEEAIIEGANIVRVGSSLFGPRIYR